MIEILIISIGLVLVIEGFLYFILASKIKDFVKIINNFNTQQIKTISLIIIIIGTCLIYFTFKLYGDIR